MRVFVNIKIMRSTLTVLAYLLLTVFGATAADYPSRTITLVVPRPPGGGVDTMARVVADKLSASFNQQVVVDNRGGAGGIIGTRSVAHATPDGYTLLLGHTGTMSINPSLYANAGYDPRKDFAPIGLIASIAGCADGPSVVSGKIRCRRHRARKKDPGKLRLRHVCDWHQAATCTAELFKSVAGVDVTIIPYNGTAPLMNDLIGGHVPVSFGVLPPALGNIAAGKLRAIAVTSTKRFAAAGRADLRRIRPARLRRHAALWPAGSRRYAAGHRRLH